MNTRGPGRAAGGERSVFDGTGDVNEGRRERIVEDDADARRFEGMTPERKLALSMELYWVARKFMIVGLRTRKPVSAEAGIGKKQPVDMMGLMHGQLIFRAERCK